MASIRTFKVTLSNSGGELDSRTIRAMEYDDEGAGLKEAAIEMLEACAYLSPGDAITVSEVAS